jgi:hypothetical protein
MNEQTGRKQRIVAEMSIFSLSIFLSQLSLAYEYVRRIHSIRIHLLSLLCVVHVAL